MDDGCRQHDLPTGRHLLLRHRPAERGRMGVHRRHSGASHCLLLLAGPCIQALRPLAGLPHRQGPRHRPDTHSGRHDYWGNRDLAGRGRRRPDRWRSSVCWTKRRAYGRFDATCKKGLQRHRGQIRGGDRADNRRILDRRQARRAARSAAPLHVLSIDRGRPGNARSDLEKLHPR